MTPVISKADLAQISQKTNRQGLVNLAFHAGLLGLFGAAFVLCWQINSVLGLAGLIASWIGYTTAYAFLGYAGLGHELNHRTVFVATWANEWLFNVVSILTWNNPVYFRASHQLHHAHTLKKGLDHEVSPQRSGVVADWWKYLFIDFQAAKRAWLIFSQNARGQVQGPLAQTVFAPNTARRRQLIRMARLTVIFHTLVFASALWLQAWWCIFLINFAAFGSTWLNRLCARLQHEGMQANQEDLKLSTRTVLLPGWLSRLYWNMNYHLEHHCFPVVPFHQLPALHQHMIQSGSCAQAEGLFASLRLLRQPAVNQED